MIEKVRATIIKYRMLEAGGNVVVGVSGGADSVAALHALLSLQGEWPLTVTAAHLNHKLRGAESDADEAFVRRLCGRLKVDLTVESADVAAIAESCGISLEEAGRKARYAFFSRCAGEKNAYRGKIAVGHNLCDSVETMLLNLARGTALRGLAGIPPVRDNVIRPLIECERREIEAYCAENGLGFVTDSTNLSEDFTRNKIRRFVIPALANVNSAFWQHAAGALEAVRRDADFLDGLAQSEETVSRERYLSLPQPVRYRILLKMLSRHKIQADAARLARLDAIAGAGSGAEQLSDEYFFSAGSRGFEVRKAREAAGYFSIPVNIPESGGTIQIDVFSDKKLRLMNTYYEYYEENIKYVGKGLKNALDCDKIDGSLVLRQKLPADKVRLAGRNCTKTLRKLFQEEKLTLSQRERVFVLADSSGIVWVEGFGAAQRAAPSGASGRLLLIQVEQSEKLNKKAEER